MYFKTTHPIVVLKKGGYFANTEQNSPHPFRNTTKHQNRDGVILPVNPPPGETGTKTQRNAPLVERKKISSAFDIGDCFRIISTRIPYFQSFRYHSMARGNWPGGVNEPGHGCVSCFPAVPALVLKQTAQPFHLMLRSFATRL